MSSTIAELVNTSLDEQPLLTFETDVLSNGQLGSGRLVVTTSQVIRLETTPLGEETVGTWPLNELKDVRTEEMVGAIGLVGRQGPDTVELFRTSSALSLRIANAERVVKALSAGDPIPPLEEDKHRCPKCGRPLPKDSNVCTGCFDKGKALIRLFGFAKGSENRLIWGAVLALSGAGLDMVAPFITRTFIDQVLKGHALGLFIPLMMGLVVSKIVLMGVQMARGRNIAFLGMRISRNIRHQLFEKLQALSLGFYDKRSVGSVMSRMTNDTGALYDILVDGLPVLLNQGITLIAVPIAMLSIDWQIGLWALAPVPLILVAVRIFRRKMHRVWARYWHSWSRLGSALTGVLQGMRVIKAFHGERREVKRFDVRIDDLASQSYEAENQWATFFPMITLSMSLGLILVWWIGGRHVLEGRVTLGDLVAITGLGAMLQQPLMMLQRIVDWTTRTLTAAQRVFEVMDTPIEVPQSENAVAAPAIKGQIEFKDVQFSYDKVRTILKGIDLQIKPGEMIGLVGSSGSGKSTLMNLLMRFYDPTQGSILIDGVSLKEIDTADLRHQMGIVLQESYLFPGSIRQNIAYGRPDASLEEIMAAAKAANAHDFVINFPDGYDAYVGERGQRLSGGERQRIAIARAILHNPKILVLDEATSSVDTETERLIQEALERLIEGRTTIAIAHRLSTLRKADRLVVMDEGQIAEIGTHDELMQREKGIYAKLVNMQNEMQENKILFESPEKEEDEESHDDVAEKSDGD